jgi:hypothetical protein
MVSLDGFPIGGHKVTAEICHQGFYKTGHEGSMRQVPRPFETYQMTVQMEDGDSYPCRMQAVKSVVLYSLAFLVTVRFQGGYTDGMITPNSNQSHSIDNRCIL